MNKILIVDDDPATVEFLKTLFTDAGYQASCAYDGMNALQDLFLNHPDLAIVDLLMPKMDGFELCRRIREISLIPIIVLTGVGHVKEKLNAFNAGADDYVVKPVSSREMMARVEACLRRAQWPASEVKTSIYTDSQLTVDFIKREVCIRGKTIELTSIEYSLLTLFVQHPDQALSLEYLMTNVWGKEYYTYDLVKWHISNLRKKLKEDWNGLEGEENTPIVTVRGFGYRYKRPPG